VAHKLKAVHEYAPKLINSGTMDINDICENISRRSSLNTGEIRNVISELKENILFYAQRGFSMKVEGLGIFRPSIDLKGNLFLNYIADPTVKKVMSQFSEYKGEIKNRDNCGKSICELVELWNKENPDDQIH